MVVWYQQYHHTIPYGMVQPLQKRLLGDAIKGGSKIDGEQGNLLRFCTEFTDSLLPQNCNINEEFRIKEVVSCLEGIEIEKILGILFCHIDAL